MGREAQQARKKDALTAVLRRGTGRETGEHELNCSHFQQGKGDCAQLRMRHQISFLTGRSYRFSQQ